MIIKERNKAEHTDTDKFSIAGAEAEEKMAFYLRRMFSDNKNIFVFNDLRFKDDSDDRVQIDHLILHRHGFVIVESKSVCSGLAVNEHGEWVRFWDGRPQGMESPIQQAKLQVEFLRRALNAYCAELVGKALLGLIQQRFTNCPMEILVAISDKGTIKRVIELPEVVKADQVPDRIKAIYARHVKARGFIGTVTTSLSNMDGVYNFSDDEMKKISGFLTGFHYPITSSPQKQVRETPKPVPVAKPKPVPVVKQEPPKAKKEAGLGICEKCGSQSVILWGKNYYWKCPKCDHNMPIREFCQTCKKKLFLRKDKNKYFIYCEICKGERLYCEFETVSQ